jgi:hypothetical protein
MFKRRKPLSEIEATLARTTVLEEEVARLETQAAFLNRYLTGLDIKTAALVAAATGKVE